MDHVAILSVLFDQQIPNTIALLPVAQRPIGDNAERKCMAMCRGDGAHDVWNNICASMTIERDMSLTLMPRYFQKICIHQELAGVLCTADCYSGKLFMLNIRQAVAAYAMIAHNNETSPDDIATQTLDVLCKLGIEIPE